MGKATVLVIDDEKDLLELVRYNLEKEGFEVITARDGESGLHVALQHQPDLILLDLMLPGTDGLEVCQLLRKEARTARVPLIMLTAKASEPDRVVGLELGADDYITKPFSPRELVARVKAILRRTAPVAEASEVIRRGELTIDVSCHEVLSAGKPVLLTATEFSILHFMAKRPGRVFSRNDIIDGAQGRDTAVLDRTIDVHMTAIRRKLGPCRDYIETVRAVGYKFQVSAKHLKGEGGRRDAGGASEGGKGKPQG